MFHFYCFNQDKKLIVSDLPVEKIKEKHGYRFEILTSVKEKESIDLVLSRLKRNYSTFTVVNAFATVRQPRGPYNKPTKKKGVPRDEATKAKISATLKGRSNFQGKRHTPETKAKMAAKKLGNTHVKGTHWAYDPRGDSEVRVKSLADIPEGYSQGRDYDSIEEGYYHCLIASKQQKGKPKPRLRSGDS